MTRSSVASADARQGHGQATGQRPAESEAERQTFTATGTELFPEAAAAWANACCSAIDGARRMLDLHRSLFDAGREALRRQQDAVLDAWSQSLGRRPSGEERHRTAPVDQAGLPLAALARLSLDAMDSMMRSLRTANDAALEASQAAMSQALQPWTAPASAETGKRRAAAAD